MNRRDEFEAAVRKAIRECYEIGYIPSRFEQMLEEKHSVEVAIGLVKSGDLQYGIKQLTKLKRQDLTIEAIMLEDRFHELFHEELRKTARWRLDAAKKELDSS